MIQRSEIKGLPGYYIHSDGKVFNNRLNRYMKPYTQRTGYISYHIKNRHYYAHRLCAEAFLSIPDNMNKYEVNHKDMDKSNNNISNLEWLTHSENINKAIDIKGKWHKGRGRGFKVSDNTKELMSKASKRKVSIYKDNVLINVCDSVQGAADYFGVTRVTIFAAFKIGGKFRDYIVIKE